MTAASLTVLLVDDEYSLVEAITELLLWEGHRVLTAGDGQQALQVLRAQRADAVLVDLMMPRMDGVELIRALWSDPELANLPVVLLTGAPGTVPADMAARVNVVRKPFDMETLLAEIDRAVGRAETRNV